MPLQEIAQERFDKTVLPRMAEEERTQQLEEQAVKRRRALALDAADSAAVEQQCFRILSLVDVSHMGVGLEAGPSSRDGGAAQG